MKFTGKDAYAAAVGLHLDDLIQDDVESGKAFWYQLDSDALDR